jgi:hypothetical protein
LSTSVCSHPSDATRVLCATSAASAADAAGAGAGGTGTTAAGAASNATLARASAAQLLHSTQLRLDDGEAVTLRTPRPRHQQFGVSQALLLAMLRRQARNSSSRPQTRVHVAHLKIVVLTTHMVVMAVAVVVVMILVLTPRRRGEAMVEDYDNDSRRLTRAWMKGRHGVPIDDCHLIRFEEPRLSNARL